MPRRWQTVVAPDISGFHGPLSSAQEKWEQKTKVLPLYFCSPYLMDEEMALCVFYGLTQTSC